MFFLDPIQSRILQNNLVQPIQPMLNKNSTRLKNSRSFVEKAKQWVITEDEIQISFDVVNLYPSIPIKESIAVMIEMLSRDDDLPNRTKLILSDIKKLIELCLDDCYFLWEDQIHSLTDSGPIGLALMVVMAEAFLQHHEARPIDPESVSECIWSSQRK